MKITDISQPVFSSSVFPGHEAPVKRALETIGEGSTCNLTAFSMCAHNGTHVDAPYHFYAEGNTIDRIDLSVFIGKCYVAR
ncbi:MAG: cyclase family protein, partial [Clostridia bacterium]|nr:cyclase family protein [Clostridia bacterium]